MGRRLAALILGLIRWRAVFVPPPGPKTVILVYPHTSNWDFPLGMLYRCWCGIGFRWAGKDTLFRWPLGGLFRELGGIPINRRAPNGTIGRLLDAFESSESIHLCIAPEGTRSRAEHWKSGFYHLARRSGVPVGLGFIDYRQRCMGVDRWMVLTGDQNADLDVIRAYYAGKSPLYAEKASPVRFKA